MAAGHAVDSGEAEEDFSEACRAGDVTVVQALLAADGDRRISGHVRLELGFLGACSGGHLGVVRELLALTGDRRIDVHAVGASGFRDACRGGHLSVVRELLALTGDRRIDVHAREEAGFREACHRGHVGVVRELLALEGDRRIGLRVVGTFGFRDACRGGQMNVVRELLALTGDRRIDVHVREEAGFREACYGGKLNVVRELLALEGDRRIGLRVVGTFGFRDACRGGQMNVVRELLALEGDRRPSLHTASGPLRRLLARQLQLDSEQLAPGFLGMLRDCVIPQAILEAAMKEACAGTKYDWSAASAQEETTGASHMARAVMHHALLHALQHTPVTHGAGLLTQGAFATLDALALCAVLPGAECRHLVGELVGCGATVPGGGAGRSIGDAFGGYYRECGWRGVSVSADEDAKDMDVSAARMRRGGRRGPVLLRAQTRAVAR